MFLQQDDLLEGRDYLHLLEGRDYLHLLEKEEIIFICLKEEIIFICLKEEIIFICLKEDMICLTEDLILFHGTKSGMLVSYGWQCLAISKKQFKLVSLFSVGFVSL